MYTRFAAVCSNTCIDRFGGASASSDCGAYDLSKYWPPLIVVVGGAATVTKLLMRKLWAMPMGMETGMADMLRGSVVVVAPTAGSLAAITAAACSRVAVPAAWLEIIVFYIELKLILCRFMAVVGLTLMVPAPVPVPAPAPAPPPPVASI